MKKTKKAIRIMNFCLGLAVGLMIVGLIKWFSWITVGTLSVLLVGKFYVNHLLYRTESMVYND